QRLTERPAASRRLGRIRVALGTARPAGGVERGMRWGRILTTCSAVVLMVGACTGRPKTPPVAPSPEASGPRTGGGPVSLSSLSGRIAFDNHDDVWIINADGTDLRRLTHSPWPEFDPSWSPDGRFVAYRSEPHGQPEVWVMKANGS